MHDHFIFCSKLINLDQSKAGHILYTVVNVNHGIVRGAHFAKIVLSSIYDLPSMHGINFKCCVIGVEKGKLSLHHHRKFI